MDEYEFGMEGTPSSKLNKVTRKLKAQRPLPDTGEIKSAPVRFTQSPEEVKQSVDSADKALRNQVAAEEAAPGFVDAFTASFGGYTRDLIERVTRETVNHRLDPKWDVGAVRESFRSKYGMEFWDALERTRNKDEYDALIKNITDEQERGYRMSGSMTGTMFGSVFDLSSLLAGGAILKGAQLASRAYNIGKTATLAGGALVEAGAFGAAESAKQVSDVGYVYDGKSVAQTMAFAGALHFGVGKFFTGESQYGALPKAATPERIEPTLDLEAFGIKEADSTLATARKELADYSQRVHEDLTLSGNKLSAADSRALKAEAKQLEHSIKFEAGRYDESFKTLAKNAQASGMSRKEAEAQARKTLEDQAGNTQGRLDVINQRLEAHKQALQAEERLNRQKNGATQSSVYADESLEPEFSPEIQAAKQEAPAGVEPPNETGAADAGAALNRERDTVQDNNILQSSGGAVFDWQDSLVRHARAIQERVGPKAYEWLNSPTGTVAKLTSNFLRGMASDSPVVRAVTGILGEDPTGVFRAGTSGTAIDKVRYNDIMRGHYADVHDEFRGWSKRTGHTGMISRTTTAGRQEFDRLLRTEMEARWSTRHLSKEEQQVLDLERWKTVDPEIKRAADALDRGNQYALDTMKQHNVLGAEGLDDVSRGYVPRRLSGEMLSDLHRLDRIKYNRVLNAMTDRLHKTIVETQRELLALGEDLPALTEARIKQLETKARAIINGMAERAIRRSTGMDGTTVGIVDRAARGEIRSILESKGMDAGDIEHTFDLIDKRLKARTGSNRLKGRMELDLATPVTLDGGEQFNLLDLYDNDLAKLTYSYSEEMSGRIAMARRGISSDNDFDAVLNAAMNSGASKEDIDLLKDMYAQMLGRPMQDQNKSKFVQLMTQLNPLQSLGQVGWAQATESSLAVSRLGLGAALKSIPVLAKIVVGARKNAVSEADAVLLKDLEAWNGPIGEYWRTHRPHTDTMERLNASGELAQGVDRLLKSGQEINGWVSFMHQIMEAQLKAISAVGTRKVADEIMKGTLTKRLADAGFDEISMKAVKRNLEKHAEYVDGQLHNPNFSKWDFESADVFTRNISRLSGQLIQRDFVGETASWMHRDMGRLMLSLRGYSVKALNKQLIRNVQIGDAIAAQSLVMGLAFSTLGYTAKMYAMSAFRTDKEEFLESRLSGDSLVMGAVGWMALGSIGSELARPLVSWSGEGTSEAGNIRGAGDRIVALIPGLAPANRALQVIDDAGMALGRKYNTGESEYGAREVRRLTQFFLGNSYPVAIGLNASLDDSQ